MRQLIAVFLIAYPLFGAFNAATQWDVRTTGAASNINGGGFAYGVGAKDVTAATDLVVDSSNNKKVTSATHNFVAGDVGKFINITAGAAWNWGWYQVLSTASNAATLDISPGAISITGGTYDLYSAVDYSQQDAAQIAYTDILVGGTTTQGTSVLNPFTAAMVGNVVNVVSGAGCTVQRAQISSVTTGTATFDKSLGTAASVCTGNLGGSLVTIAAAIGLWVTTNTIHVKAGTYTITTKLIYNSDTGNLTVAGFGTNHNDNGTKPLITTSTNNTTIWSLAGSSNNTLITKNLSMSSTGTTGNRYEAYRADGGPYVSIINCIMDGFSKGISGDIGDTGGFFQQIILVGSEIKNMVTGGLSNPGVAVLSAGDIFVQDSYIHDATAECVYDYGSGRTIVVDRSILAKCNNGVRHTNNGVIQVTSTVISLMTTDGVLSNTATSNIGWRFENNIIYGNGGWGMNLPATPPKIWLNQYNAYGANTSGNVQNGTVGDYPFNLTASPFTNSGGGNYALNSTAGAGLPLQRAGAPTFQGGTSTGYIDVGAVQTSGAPGVGGAYSSAFAQ